MFAAKTAAVALTADGSGNCTAYSDPITGRVLAVLYTPGTLATGADLTITTETTAQTIVVLTNAGTSNVVKYPRPLVQDAAGADTTLREPVLAANERIKIALVQGGAAGAGSIAFVYG